MVRDWYDGLDESGRRLTLVLLAVCLASLPLYALGVWQLSARAAHTEEIRSTESVEEAPSDTPVTAATPTPPAVSTGVQNLNAGQARPVQLAPAPPPPQHPAPPGRGPDEKKADHPGGGEKEHGHPGGH